MKRKKTADAPQFPLVTSNKKRKYVGFLDVAEAETDEDVSKAIERIVVGAQITRR